MSGGETLAGTVVEFDAGVGLGLVAVSEDGASGGASGASGRSYPFHCTQIAGGSRTIEVGTPVTFSIVAGRLGRWEAADVTPVGPREITQERAS